MSLKRKDRLFNDIASSLVLNQSLIKIPPGACSGRETKEVQETKSMAEGRRIEILTNQVVNDYAQDDEVVISQPPPMIYTEPPQTSLTTKN